ncbi:MAG: sulfite exporter TauE/SafE family protein, partial [Rufibacter sp.]
KQIALVCNLVVGTGSTYLFTKEGFFEPKKFLPLAICSVPAAFFGATIALSQKSFFISLGCVLALSGLLLVLQLFYEPKKSSQVETGYPWLWNVGLGAGTGFLAGLVGIGGGILLAPFLHLLRWGQARTIAALASFFILVNSVAGLLGMAASGNFQTDVRLLLPLALAVFVGGQLGTRISLYKLNANLIKGLTGIFVLYIGVKLVFSHI